MSTKLDDLSIAELRATAKSLKIDMQKDWTREAFIDAIEKRRKNKHVARVVMDPDNDPLQKGYTRISIPRGEFGNDAPVPIAVNQFQTIIPRETVVDVPNEAIEALKMSVQPILKYGDPDENGNNVPKIMSERSYPFETIQRTSGASGAVKPSNSPQIQGLRVKFRDIFGRWPKRDEFRLFHDEYMATTRKTAFSNEEVMAAMALVSKAQET